MMKRFLITLFVVCLLVTTICTPQVFTSYAESDEIEALRNTLKEYLGKCIDYEQYMHFDIDSTGYTPFTVTFSFDFRSGNQGVSFNVNDKSFHVVTYKEGDLVPLIAFYKLLDLYKEIAAQLPSDYTLYYKLFFGDAHGDTHTVEITPTTYQLFIN